MGQKEKRLRRMYSLSVSLVVCWMLLCAPAITKAQGTSVTKKDVIYTYDAENDSYTVTGHVARPDWETHTYTVLSVIDGKPVRKVASGALGCRYVSLPDSVVELSSGAFSSYVDDPNNPTCALKGIHLGKGIKRLNGSLSTAKLEKLVIPGNITRLDNEEFMYCSKLKEIHLEPGVRSIGADAFAVCNALKKVYIPSTVTYIDKFAFRDAPDSVVICCSPYSYAWQYALDHDMKYKLTYDVDNILKETTVKASVTSLNKIKVSWKLVGWADGYRIYRSATGKEGSFTMLKKITNGEVLSYTDKTVKAGRRYYYRVRAYRMDEKTEQISCHESNTASAKTKTVRSGK